MAAKLRVASESGSNGRKIFITHGSALWSVPKRRAGIAAIEEASKKKEAEKATGRKRSHLDFLPRSLAGTYHVG